jgi:membrane associated rhomboid family serine protease
MTRARKAPSDDARLSPQAEAALARLRFELGRERYDEAQVPAPSTLDHVAGSLGLPVLLEPDDAAHPWVTWIAGALAVLVGARALWRGSDEEESSRNLARELGLTLKDATTAAPAESSGLLEQAFESAFTPASWPQLLFGAYFFVLFAARAESLLGRARVAALLTCGLIAAAVAQLPRSDAEDASPAFLLGATTACAAFAVLRTPRVRVAALLGMGWSVLRIGDSPWLQLPLWFWALLAAGQYALYASVWGFEPLAPVFAAALVGAAAAAPSVARRWGSRAQPSPSTRL